MDEESKELKISFDASPGSIRSEVLEDLRKYVERTSRKYQDLVVTPENMKDAKGDLAMLRKSYEDLESERKRVKTLWNTPYIVWEDKYRSAIAGLTRAIDSLDSQIKAFETKEMARRASTVESEIWTEARNMDSRVASFLELYPTVFGSLNRKEYTNKSYSSNKRILEIREALLQISRDLSVIGEDETLQALYVECGNLSMAQLKKKEHEEKAQKLAEEQKRKKSDEERKRTAGMQIPSTGPRRSEYRPRYTFEEINIPRMDENHLGADDLKKARLKRTFVGPRYKLLALMAAAEAMGIAMEKESSNEKAGR